MKHHVAAAVFSVALGFSGGAFDQTYSADDGDPAVTEPGGTMGRDGAENIRERLRDGEAVGGPRGTVVEEQMDGRGRPVPPSANAPR